jgi:hypothetical protein
MRPDWKSLSDDDLTISAQQQRYNAGGAVVESMRRLRVSLDALRKSSDRYAKWMMFLTVVLTVLTALLVYKELWSAH